MSKIDTRGAIVIGNAPSVLFNEYGHIIDQFDVVIRMNSFEIDGYEKYVGTKTNIWSRTHGEEMAVKDGANFDEVWLKDGWQDKRKDFDTEGKSWGEHPVLNHDKTKLHTLKVWQMEDVVHGNQGDMWMRMNCTTGFCSIKTALERFDRVTTYGFTFFQNQKNDGVITKPHYYDKEPPVLSHNFRKPVDEWLTQPYRKEKEAVVNWHKQGKLNFLFPEEVFDVENLDFSQFNDWTTKTPEHLVGKGIKNYAHKITGVWDSGELLDYDNPDWIDNEDYDHKTEKRIKD